MCAAYCYPARRPMISTDEKYHQGGRGWGGRKIRPIRFLTSLLEPYARHYSWNALTIVIILKQNRLAPSCYHLVKGKLGHGRLVAFFMSHKPITTLWYSFQKSYLKLCHYQNIPWNKSWIKACGSCHYLSLNVLFKVQDQRLYPQEGTACRFIMRWGIKAGTKYGGLWLSLT